MTKLAEPWWDEVRNPITGLRVGSYESKGYRNNLSYDATDYDLITYLNKK